LGIASVFICFKQVLLYLRLMPGNQGTMGGAFHEVRGMCFFEFYFKKMEFVKSPLLYALKASQ